MNIRETLKEYTEKQAAIKILEREIEERKLDLVPSNTQVISDEPICHNNESKVEKTVLKIEKDSQIQSMRREITKIRLDLGVIDQMISALPRFERNVVIMRYKQGMKWEEIAAELNCDYTTACRTSRRAEKNMDELYRNVIKRHKDAI